MRRSPVHIFLAARSSFAYYVTSLPAGANIQPPEVVALSRERSFG